MADYKLKESDDDFSPADLLKPEPQVEVYDGGSILLINKSDAEDWERFDEFEAAAETAATQHDPNLCRFCGSGATDFGKNEPTVYCHDCGREYREPEFMTEAELNARVVKRCPLGHSPRGTTFGGDALHHSCGCSVLKGEELV